MAGQLIASWEQGFQRWLQRERVEDVRRVREQSIDFGNGATLGPEDVLETHFQRLARSRHARTAAPRTRTRTVPVQVGDNLVAAIAVLAPHLAPLTELAEDVAETVAPVQPEQTFRDSLHHALEQTHRQHAAQRVLGTRKREAFTAAHKPGWIGLTAAGAVLCVAALGLWWLARRLFK